MRTHLPFPFAILHLIACGPSPAEGVTSANLQLAEASFTAFNEHDWDRQASYFSDSCQYLDPSYGQGYLVKTRLQKADLHRKLHAWSPDIKDSVTSMLAANDKVVIQFVSSGTFMQDSVRITWSQPICTVYTIKDGQIIVDETYYDRGN